MAEALVIIPTFNEIENIERMIRTVVALPDEFDILVVDDGSPDGTANAVRKMAKEFPGRVNLIEREGKLGLGTAYIAGFKWGLARGYQYLTEMDADFSHNPNDLGRLLNACRNEGADVAVGSRYITGVNVVNWPIGRILMSYGASTYVRVVTGLKVKDSTAGFVCWKAKVLQTMNLDEIEFKGYAFQIEMKFKAAQLGFKIVEVPIVFINRVLGQSKMNSSIFGEALIGVVKLRLNSLFKSKK